MNIFNIKGSTMAHSKEEIEYIKKFINENPTADIILASDSQRVKKKRVKFATVVIIHYQDDNGIGKGAKVFYDVIYENVSDGNLSRPFNRMMKEVEMVTKLYGELEDVLILRDFSIHLDVNPKKSAGSNVAYDAAKWTVMGLTGVEPVTKPNAWAASCCADRYTK